MSQFQYPAGGGFLRSHTPMRLVLPGKSLITAPATLLSGTNYKAGSVLGKITAGAVSSAAKAGGNGSADGTFVLDATSPKRIGIKAGVYTLRVIAVPATHATDWELRDPDGFSLGVYKVTGSGGTVTVDNDIKGVITDGATDFAVGHGFDITVAAGSNKLCLAAAAAEDGSAIPGWILAEDCDASAADKNVPVYVEGYFNEEALTFGAGHTADTVRDALRKVGIHLMTDKWSI